MPWMAAAAVGGGIGIVSGLIGSSGAKKAAQAQASAIDRSTQAQVAQDARNRADNAPFLKTGVAANQRLAQLLGLSRGTGSAASGSIAREQFDGDAYLAANPDVAKAGADPYTHYLQFGMPEGRQGYKLGDFQSGAGTSPEDIMKMDPGYQFRMDQGLNATKNSAVARGSLDSGATLKALTRFGQDYASGEFGNVVNRLAGASGTGQTATAQNQASGTNMTNNVSNLTTDAGNARAAGIVGGANAWGSAATGVGSAYNNYQNSEILRKLLAGKGSGFNPSASYGGQNLAQDDYSAGYYGANV